MKNDGKMEIQSEVTHGCIPVLAFRVGVTSHMVGNVERWLWLFSELHSGCDFPPIVTFSI